MANYNVTTVGIPLRETRFTFIGQDIKNADVGKAVTLVVGAEANTVKLVSGTEPVLGRIETVEIEMDESVTVSVLIMGGYRLNCAPNEVFKAGDSVIAGATAGLVKAGPASEDLRFFVSEPDSSEGFVGVIKL